MTSASIMEMSKTGFAVQGNVAKTPQVPAGAQFSEAMDFASASQSQEENTEVVQNSDVTTHAEKSASQHAGRKEIREVDDAETTPEVSEEQVSDEMDAKEEKVVKEIAEQFGVSEEQVREAMEMLGISLMDLLSQGNMASLVAQLTEMQTVDVLTDENLFAQITEMTAEVSDELQAVADSLGMSLEQLQVMVEEQAAAKEEVQMPQVFAEEIVTEENQTAEPETVKVQENVEYKPETERVVQDNETEVQTAGVSEEKQPEMEGQQKQQDDGEPELMQSGQNVQVLKGEMKAELPGQNTAVFESSMDAEQTRELINQIAEYVRVNRSESMSSMEIQLHPAELGTVNLQVVAKDGAISARLAVQDEMVRTALESQVVQLRETLQQQGLKIDAVEVTVATHEFEQNLDRHGREAEERAAKEKKNGRKILDLNEIGQEEFEGGEMSEADRLQVEMMRMGGNRLNLRV